MERVTWAPYILSTVLIKYGPIRKPTVIKAYVGVFVSMAVHLELISDLTAESFIAALRQSHSHCSILGNSWTL